jgi:4-amino-4-deoxy-L-arabinose transferase-like glycosyltransferase
MTKVIPLTILLIVLYFIFFLHLGRQPIRMWDESRLAHNAYEMSKDGSLIVTHFEGNPEMWNLKPPLMIWCQVFFIKLIGPNETAIRLPSAICGLLTSLLLLYFCSKHLNKISMGFFAALVLATTNRYIDEHGVRYGEYEGMLVFFTTLYVLYFYLYFERKNIRHLYIATAALIFAVLTKGIAGMFVLPVCFLSVFFFPGSTKFFRSRHLYICILLFLFFAGGYYFLRESMNPGYLTAVMNNEIWGRYVSPIEIHDGSFWMYWDYMKNRDMSYWLPLIFCGLVAGLISAETAMRNICIYSFSCFLFLFLLISTSASKLFWYIYPSYPFLALLAAYFIWIVFKILSDFDVKRYMKYNALPYLFVFVLFLYPYDSLLARIYLAPEKEIDKSKYSIGYYLQSLVKGKELPAEPIKIYYTDYNAHITYYLNILKEKNVPVTLTDFEHIRQNDLVACSIPRDKTFLAEHFVLDSTERKDFVIYRIHQSKILGTNRTN